MVQIGFSLSVIELHVSYRGSSLSRDEFRVAIPWQLRARKAGDCAPDVALRFLHSGETTTLFQLLSKLRPLVFICLGSKEKTDPLLDLLKKADLEFFFIIQNPLSGLTPQRTHYLLDFHGDFEALYGLNKDFVCLIRPDGHIGLVQHPISNAGVNNYLKLICPDHTTKD